MLAPPLNETTPPAFPNSTNKQHPLLTTSLFGDPLLPRMHLLPQIRHFPGYLEACFWQEKHVSSVVCMLPDEPQQEDILSSVLIPALHCPLCGLFRHTRGLFLGVFSVSIFIKALSV